MEKRHFRAVHPWRWGGKLSFWLRCQRLERIALFAMFYKLRRACVGFWWMGCGGAGLNCVGLAHHWNKSQSFVMDLNCVSQANVGASMRAHEGVFIS